MISKFLFKAADFAYLLRDLLERKVRVVDANYLLKLEAKVKKLQEDNDKMMMTFYSARAARTIMDEIREILDCPVGHDIIDAVKKLRNNE
jgi:hypothetical protein